MKDSATTKIIIADDHVVLREGIKALLISEPTWEVIAEADDGLALLDLVNEFAPDVVVLDLSMPNLGGIEAIERLSKFLRRPQILVLSAKEDERTAMEAVRAGANGFVPKSSGIAELKFALQALIKGQSYLSPSVCSGFLRGNLEDDCSLVPGLSTREREVMKLICEGMPNREIAKLLHISPRTIDSHRTNIMKKTGARTNTELVKMALRNGLVE